MFPVRMRAWLLSALVGALLGSAVPAGAAEPPPGVYPAATREGVGSTAQSAGHSLGWIHIPAIGLSHSVLAGVSLDVLDEGVGHWAGTSWAGGSGNVVLAGHRTTYSAPFADLDLLAGGDLVFVGDQAGTAVYRISGTFVVEPTDVWITYETGRPIVTLFACHPKGSARYRIVARGALVEYRIH
jgi:sortase A